MVESYEISHTITLAPIRTSVELLTTPTMPNTTTSIMKTEYTIPPCTPKAKNCMDALYQTHYHFFQLSFHGNISLSQEDNRTPC